MAIAWSSKSEDSNSTAGGNTKQETSGQKEDFKKRKKKGDKGAKWEAKNNVTKKELVLAKDETLAKLQMDQRSLSVAVEGEFASVWMSR